MTNRKFSEHIRALINASQKSDQQIAEEIGYERGSVIGMVRVGAVKLPLEKVPAFARALNADVTELCRLALEEYSPVALKLMREHLGGCSCDAGG
jgi:hypothetical protein